VLICQIGYTSSNVLENHTGDLVEETGFILLFILISDKIKSNWDIRTYTSKVMVMVAFSSVLEEQNLF
jgi:hypothetical protein